LRFGRRPIKVLQVGSVRRRGGCRLSAARQRTVRIGSSTGNPNFDRIRHVDQGAIADNKRLGPILAMIRDEQLRRGPERRSGPRRRDQREARLFKVG
jgi:predicted pyridoxine 5'-phosphate oxidase superfamily flavin-nucleotide-binding protein